MRSKFFTGALALTFALSIAGVSMAQEKKVEEKTPVDVSGKLYIQWGKDLKRQDGSTKGENTNSFDLTRSYISFGKKIDDIWSVKVTLDAGNDTGGSDTRYVVFVKNAYGQAERDFGGVKANFQFGMIGTAAIGHIDKVSDYRWLNNNYLDASKSLLYKTDKSIGQSIDTSADMGTGLSIDIMKMVKLTGQVTNGEGYKKTDDNDQTKQDDGKAYLGMITLTPVEGLSLAGFYKKQDTKQDQKYNEKKNNIVFYGGTAAYSTGLIKVGASYVLSDYSKADNTEGAEVQAMKYTIVDAFLLANLESAIGVPILLSGRYALGKSKFDKVKAADEAIKGKEAEVTIMAAGAGYAFNKNVRFMAYYEDQKAKKSDDLGIDWKQSNRKVYVKSEFVF